MRRALVALSFCALAAASAAGHRRAKASPLRSLLAVGGSPPKALQLRVVGGGAGPRMPLLGFGTCCRDSAKGPALRASVAAYLRLGGRLIDTAIAYKNHKDVGAALGKALGGELKREDVWVTSKIPPDAAATAGAAEGLVDKSLRDLGLDHVDLFLIHAPGPNAVEIWKGLMQARTAGKTRAIGVSNFSPQQIQELESATGERPAVNQIEFHPWAGREAFENVKWCQANGVAITAYGSLGSNYHKGLEDAKVLAVAKKHDATPAQVLLRWALDQGVAVVPGATSEAHIAEDIAALDVRLGPEERAAAAFGS